MNFSKELEDFKKPFTELKNEHYCSKLTGKYQNIEENKSYKILQELNLKTGKDRTLIFYKSDTF